MNYEEIEKELDEQIEDKTYALQMELGGNASYDRCKTLAIKTFYREKLQQAEQRGSERAVEYIRAVGTAAGGDIGIYCVSQHQLEAAKHPSSSKEV